MIAGLVILAVLFGAVCVADGITAVKRRLRAEFPDDPGWQPVELPERFTGNVTVKHGRR